MDPVALQADLESRVDELADAVMTLASINSGSFNSEGVNRCGEQLAELGESLSPTTTQLVPVGPTITINDDGARVPSPMGKALVMTKRPDSPFRVCVFGHLDTVFGPDHVFQSVERHDDMLFGPGVADCKGGLIIALEALRHLDTTPWGGQVGWDFVAVPDEEVGSHGSKALLAEIATGCHLGIGVEPALPSGGVAAARKGSLTVHAVVRGRAAHVGRAHGEGRSAIRAAARLVDRIESANSRSGVTVNCGYFNGGGALNVVPDFAIASFNIRVESPDDHEWITDQLGSMADAVASEDEVTVDVDWISARPPKLRSGELETVLADVEAAGAMLGQPTVPEDTGGSCDGNDLAAAGLVNVDSLGIRGGGIHSSDEFAEVSSIPSRVATMAYVIHQGLDRHKKDQA